MSLRILIICLGFVLTYAAVFFGDGLYVVAANDYAANPKDGVIATFVGFSSFAAFAIAVYLWTKTMYEFISKWTLVREDESALVSVGILILVSFFYGVVAAPFENYGPFPWYWTSRWNLFPLVALVPTVFIIHGIITEVIAERRRIKSNNNVTPIRKDIA